MELAAVQIMSEELSNSDGEQSTSPTFRYFPVIVSAFWQAASSVAPPPIRRMKQWIFPVNKSCGLMTTNSGLAFMKVCYSTADLHCSL